MLFPIRGDDGQTASAPPIVCINWKSPIQTRFRKSSLFRSEAGFEAEGDIGCNALFGARLGPGMFFVFLRKFITSDKGKAAVPYLTEHWWIWRVLELTLVFLSG